MDKISVIIPVYNVERYLRECLDSIINQTYRNLEIICIDDGSPDNSINILKDYSKIDNRIFIKQQQNRGLSKARNEGIKISTGKYLIFVDSDDWLPLDAIELLYKKIKKENSDIVIGGRITITNFKRENFIPTGEDINFTFEKYLEYSMKKKEFRAVAWGKLYKKEIIEKNNLEFPKGLLYEDLLFVLKYLYYSEKISILSKEIYYYRNNNLNSIVNTIKIKDLDSLEIIEKLEKFLEENNQNNILKKEYFQEYIYNWIIYTTLGKFFNNKINFNQTKNYLKKIEKNSIFNKYANNYLKLSHKIKRNRILIYSMRLNLYLTYLFFNLYRMLKNLKNN